MEKINALKFTLSGKLACFRKPETNAGTYLTYSCIHKVALMGILKGYNQIKKEKGVITLPEFHEKLKKLKISIIAPRENIVQQVISFNNSTGIASQEEGGNLIVKETVLNNPSWEIFILDDKSEEYNKIKDYILNSKSKFIPFLGRNDYYANISNTNIVELEKNNNENLVYDSIVIAELKDCLPSKRKFGINIKDFLTIEELPISLNKKTAHYEYQQFLNTTSNIRKKENTYNYANKVLFFF